MEDSFEKRYIIKLFSTIIVVLANAGIQLIIPRAFTIEQYADYTYNLNIFTSVLAISMLSMDGAFISKLSKRLKESSLILFYGKFLLLVVACLNIGVIIIFSVGFNNLFFTNQSFSVVLLALNASISLKLLQEITSLFDCYALTRYSEPLLAIQKVLLTIVTYFFYINTFLNIKVYYIVQVTIILLFGLFLVIWFYKKNKELFIYEDKTKNNYIKEFYEYCKPLVFAGILSNCVVIASNWLLKSMGGNQEQAFFGVAWQLNSLIVYTFTPLTVLLQREFAVRVYKKAELVKFYKETSAKVMLIVCFFSCFVIVNGDKVLEALFGVEYIGAMPVTVLIMIYTIFQAWGQVEGAMFTASERTTIYAKITMVTILLSIVWVYLFQIPNIIWPKGLGSVGMGFQKAVGNIVSVMLLLYYNCKYLEINFRKEARIPIGLTVLFCFVAYLCRKFTAFIGADFICSRGAFIQFIVYGMIYGIICLMLLFVVSRCLKFSIYKPKGRP